MVYTLNMFVDCKIYKFAALSSQTGRAELQFIRGTLISWRYGSVGSSWSSTKGNTQSHVRTEDLHALVQAGSWLGEDLQKRMRAFEHELWEVKKAKEYGAVLARVQAANHRMFPPPSIWHLRDCIWITVSSFGLPSIRHWKGPDRSLSRLWGTFHIRIGWENWFWSAWRREHY